YLWDHATGLFVVPIPPPFWWSIPLGGFLFAVLHVETLRIWPVRLFLWYVIEPLAVCAVLFWLFPEQLGSLRAAILAFLVINFLLHSRFGIAVGEAKEGLLQVLGWRRVDSLTGLIRVISGFFKRLTDNFEAILHTVDERLRKRNDETRLSLVVRALLGVLWF